MIRIRATFARIPIPDSDLGTLALVLIPDLDPDPRAA